MAVYTPIEPDEVQEFLRDYNVGHAVSIKGIAEGVENSNFYLETKIDAGALSSTSRFILTIYEKRVNPADLPWFLGLMQHVAARGFRCAEPVPARDGALIGTIRGKPAALITFLPGLAVTNPKVAEAAAAGHALAQFHLTAQDFPQRRANALGPASWREMGARLRPKAAAAEAGWAELLDHALALLPHWPEALPEGPIHADFFPDNVFFVDHSFAGAIDFYFACNDFLAYDLAIALNAWAMDPNGHLDRPASAALLAAYHGVQPLLPAECAAFPVLAAGAALRFFLTRLMDWQESGGAMVRDKDPGEYARKLGFHLAIVQRALSREAKTCEASETGIPAYGWDGPVCP